MKTEHAGWIGAISLFGVGDLATTIVGLTLFGVAEQHPAGIAILATLGFGGLILWKAAVVGLFAGVARYLPAPHRIGVPLGLSLLGGIVTIWNLGVMLA